MGAAAPKGLGSPAPLPAIVLRPSLPTIVSHVVVVVAAGWGARYIQAQGATVFVWLVVAALAIGALGMQSLALDETALTLVPLVPIRPRRRLVFSGLGPFTVKKTFWTRWSPYTFICAPITIPEPQWNPLFGSRRKLTLSSPYFGLSWGGAALDAEAFTELLERYRTHAAGGISSNLGDAGQLAPPPTPLSTFSKAPGIATMQPLTPTTTQQTNPSAAGVTVEFHWADGTAGEPRNVALALLGLNQKPEPGTIINYSGKRWRVGDVSPSVEGDSVSGSYPLIELGG